MNNLLLINNIIPQCEPDTKENIIRKVGQMLVDNDYVEPSYIDAMFEREISFSTYLGNGLAIPHGIETSRNQIKKSGIVVLTVPEGVVWDDDEKAKVIIGIAGVGDEHIDILSKIAETLMEPENIDKMVASSQEEIYEMFCG